MRLTVFCSMILWWLLLLFEFSSLFKHTGLLIFMVVGWSLALRQVVNFHKEIKLHNSTISRFVRRLSCEFSCPPPICRCRSRSLRPWTFSVPVGQLPFRAPWLIQVLITIVSSRYSIDSWNKFCLLGRENKKSSVACPYSLLCTQMLAMKTFVTQC